MNLRVLLRMSKWARHPPSDSRVKFGLALIAVLFLIFAVERWIGWPAWLQLDQASRGLPRR